MWTYCNENTAVTRTNANGSVDSRLLTDREVQEWIAAGNTPAPDPEWTLANVKARKLAEIRAEAASILYAKWPQWLRDNFNIGMDAELKPLYAADVALIRSESGCATPGQESGFEGDVALLTTIDEVLAYTYTFTAI